MQCRIDQQLSMHDVTAISDHMELALAILDSSPFFV